MTKLIQQLVAEFVGTFALCFVGIAAINHFNGESSGLLGIALAHGLTIGVMAAATMHISGAQLNPAVTIAVLCAKKMDIGSAIAYIVTQCAAGAAAAAVLLSVLPQETIASGTPALAPEGVSIVAGILLEIVATYFLVFVIFGVAVDKRASSPQIGGIFIGLAVTIGILCVGPFTGAAMNPARHFGPALVSGNAAAMQMIWLYWLAPIIGGVAASLTWTLVLFEKE